MPQFTILHHGVPLGTAFTTGPTESEDEARLALNLMDFAPGPAFESVRPLARLAAEAFFGGFFGPLVDLKAATDAVPAAERLWAELELADAQGRPVAGRVSWLLEDSVGGQPSYWVDVELDDATADVPAKLPNPTHDCRTRNHFPPNVI